VPQPKSSKSSKRSAQQGSSGNGQRSGSGKRSAAKKRGSGSGSGGQGGAPGPAPALQTDEQLQEGLVAVRERLARGLVLSGDRLQETVEDAVKRGRLTGDDAEELVSSLVTAGRKQAEDLLEEVERLLGRTRDSVERQADDARRRTRSRVGTVASAARKAPGTDRVLREVDRARRAAGLGPGFPITGYDDLTAAQITERLDDLAPADLRTIRDHERRNANRKSVLAAVDRKLD
jgi:polyhydroxyalkanoate synthesis regulator phasin